MALEEVIITFLAGNCLYLYCVLDCAISFNSAASLYFPAMLCYLVAIVYLQFQNFLL
jgi:hypothetical protein